MSFKSEKDRLAEPVSQEELPTLALTNLLDAVDKGAIEADPAFKSWLEIIADPVERKKYPTNDTLAKKLKVSVMMLKTWKMTAQAAKAVEIMVAQAAKMAMPDVLNAMVREAKKGNPRAAGVVVDLAKMGKNSEQKTGETFESALQKMVLDRLADQAPPKPVVVDMKPVPGRKYRVSSPRIPKGNGPV